MGREGGVECLYGVYNMRRVEKGMMEVAQRRVNR